jgi:hypothetical protein
MTTPLPWPPAVARTPKAITAHRLLSALPPGLGVVDLAERMRRPQSTAWRWARMFGYVTHADLRLKRWAAVDWARANAEIARELGVTRRAVAKQRRKAEATR